MYPKQVAETIDEAVAKLDAAGVTQPLVFHCHDQYWIKADHTAIPVLNVSCFSDCIEALIQFFFVFHVDYPHELRLSYGFVERVLGIKATVGRSLLIDQLLNATSI